MCYSKSASLISFITSLVGCVVLFAFDKVLALFLGFVGLMQLWDYIFWAYPGQNVVNAFFTKVAMVSNHLQPLVLIALLSTRQQVGMLSAVLGTIYGVLGGLYTIVHWNDTSYTVVTSQSYPSLYWEWNTLTGALLVYALYMASLLVTFYQHYTSPLNWILMATTLGSFVFAWYYYKGKSVGRFWCYFAAFMPLLLAGYYSWTEKD